MRIILTPDHRAPSHARSFVSTQLAEKNLPANVSVADVVLTASELVTNAVRAGAVHLDLSLRLNRAQLELSVEDDGGGWPALEPATADAVRGRGLNIVEQVSHRWQVTETTRGKRVTATWFAPGALAAALPHS